ncbi:MAG: DUF2950 family protein, partial [Planctomycetota bacterium]
PGFIVIVVIILAGVSYYAFLLPTHRHSEWIHNEKAAETGVKALATAEVYYRNNDLDGDGIKAYWMGDVRGLHTNPGMDAKMIALIPANLAGADADPGPSPVLLESPQPQPKNGYWFIVMQLDPDGNPYPQDLNNDGRICESEHRFAFCAYPADYPDSGRQTFIVNEEGTVWRKDTGGARVIQWPAKPAIEGWMTAD